MSAAPQPTLGTEEGEACNRNGCIGVIALTEVENCRCHINPPCSACVNSHFYCPECDWNYDGDDGDDA
jgi:hypothetical protein